MVSKADLHVHSKYSNRPTEWILRRIGAPECYTPPREVYETARRRGMQFVTISDHNCIDGALEIAHLPGAFLSNEITAYFPDDRCKVHVLCWDITEAQSREIQRLRQNIVDLRDYLCAEAIAHACAHPLYGVNDRLTIARFEQLLLLFNVFEGLNGARHERSNALVRAVLDQLTPSQIEEMADRHDLAPVGETPWLKGTTGGSDDHSGLFIAKAYTEAPRVNTIEGFFDQVRGRRTRARGIDGSPLAFAHGLYGIGYQYYRDRFFARASSGRELLASALTEVFRRTETPPPVSLRARVSHYARRLTGRHDTSSDRLFKEMVSTEMVALFGDEWTRDDVVASPRRDVELNRRTFALSCRLANHVLFQFARAFTERLSAGRLFDSLEALSAAAPVALGVAPYVFSFSHQNRDKAFLADIRRRFLRGEHGAPPAERKAWFTDTLTDVNGVTTFVRTVAATAEHLGHDLTVVSVGEAAPPWAARSRNFLPVGFLPLPEAEAIRLPFPPLLEIVDYCDSEQFTEIVVSTPGPTGLAGLCAGRILGARVVGIYHTDLPQYVRYYTEDDALESATWAYLRWFYGQMDAVYVPSRAYWRQLVARGFDESTLRLLPHGVDAEAFHPRHRAAQYWSRHHQARGTVVVYVGRVAREKDLDLLADAYASLAPIYPDATFAVVGDGPERRAMMDRLRCPNVVFTGMLEGDALSEAYAGADIFVFPSTTDTLGNVVLEAMASGLAVIVSDRGGPQELVRHGVTGLITRGRDRERLLEAIETLLVDPDRRRRLGHAARLDAEHRGWAGIVSDFWDGRTPPAPETRTAGDSQPEWEAAPAGISRDVFGFAASLD